MDTQFVNRDCIFCKIALKEVPSPWIDQSDRAYVIRDIAPSAPHHLLVIPKFHVENISEAFEKNPEDAKSLLGELHQLGDRVAKSLGLNQLGYRLVINTGQHGGQTVHHLHLHLLGGKQLTGSMG